MKTFFKVLLWIVILAAGLAGIAYVLKNNKAENDAKTAIVAEQNTTVLVRTDTVSKQALELDFSVNGTFIPSQELTFSSEKPGRVVQVMVKEGSTVKPGQVLATVRTDQLSVDLQNAEAIYQNAEKELARYESAYATGGVTQQQLEQAKLSVQNAKARVEQAKINIGDANIRSSISGVVNKRMIEPGSVLGSNTPMFEIVNVSRLKLSVAVSEGQIITLKVGDPVQVKAAVFPDKSFNGRITFIAPKADQNLNFPVEIEVQNNAGMDLKAGMYGSATFEQPQQLQAILVPRTAFIGGVSANQVFMLADGNIARIHQVTAGRILNDQVEVLAGLKEGDILITSGQVNLTDGTEVSPVQ